MEQLGPLPAAVEATVADLVDRKVRRADLGPRPHALAGRPHRGGRPARLARRRAPRCSPTGERLDAFADALRRRRPHPRGRDGHGRLEPVPRGARPHLPAPARPRSSSRVLDTTDPAAVARVGHECPVDAHAVPRVVEVRVAPSRPAATSSTSGPAVGRPEQFAVVTDPGCELATLAAERGFRAMFENRPDIGGRYSALSLLRAGAGRAGRASTGRRSSARRSPWPTPSLPTADPAHEPGLRLGGDPRRGRAGRPRQAHARHRPATSTTFGLWLEQLLAESTGKHGTGVVPIAGERARPARGLRRRPALRRASATHHGLDAAGRRRPPGGASSALRRPARPRRPGAAVGGGHRLCGAVLGINPFDQPNVAEAKEATADGARRRRRPDIADRAARDAARPGRPGRLRGHPGLRRPRGRRGRRASRTPAPRSATGSGWPPRSGSGPASSTPPASCTRAARRPACSSRWSATTPTDVAIPGRPSAFSTLKQAQADGDLLHPAGATACGPPGSRSTTCVEVTR